MEIGNSDQPIVDITKSDISEVRVDLSTQHRSLFAKVNFDTDDVVTEFHWENIHLEPSYLTLQISHHEHVELLPGFLACTNHSCDPNCFFDIANQQLISIRPIREGEELTFFYPSTEWDMDRPFQCRCQAKNCIGLIKGAKYLSEELIKKYRFTNFILEKLASK